MSKYKLPGAGELSLPSPRSPLELDERILSAAREHAPESKPLRQPLWWGAAATASMLLVAVFIALPQQFSPLLNTKQEAARLPVMAPAALSQPSATTRTPSEAAQKATPGPRRKAALDRSGPGDSEMNSTAESEAVRDPKIQGLQFYDSNTAGRIEADVEMADDSLTKKKSRAASSRDHAAEEQFRERAAPMQLRENPRLDMPAQAAADNTIRSIEPELLTELQAISDLLQAGEEDKARAQYSALRKRCTDCDLPDTLEQAIEQYPGTQR